MFGVHYVNIRGQHLVEYNCSEGGDMIGSFNSTKVKRSGDHATIIVESAESHDAEKVVKEYAVSISVMDELEEIIRKEKMNFWNKKKFTNMFVSDGSSKGYRFNFDKGEISFSSQIYPQKYSDKLRLFDEVISGYIN